MKIIAIVFALLSMTSSTCTQDDPAPTLEAYFSAIIVADLDTSLDWYTNNLGFSVGNTIESDETGFKQANLNQGTTLLELIQLDSAVRLEDVVRDYNSRTRTIGLFKLGFRISDFDRWVKSLTARDVEFYGNIVANPVTGKRMMIVTDPDGNRIQLFER